MFLGLYVIFELISFTKDFILKKYETSGIVLEAYQPVNKSKDVIMKVMTQDVIDTNLTRQDFNSKMSPAVQADSTKLTENGFSIDLKSTRFVDLKKSIKNGFDRGLYLIMGCFVSISDIPNIMKTCLQPPIYVDVYGNINNNKLPDPQIIIDLAENSIPVNCYDIPVLARRKGVIYQSIPLHLLPWKLMIEAAFTVYLHTLSLNDNGKDFEILLSAQFSVVEPNKSSSLTGVHFDNIMTPAEEYLNSENNTTAFPTGLFTAEVIKGPNGEAKYVDSDSKHSMGTVVYGQDANEETIIQVLRESAKIDVKKHFVPLEALCIFLKYAFASNIKMYKCKNNVLSFFAHLHKAVVNYSPSRVYRFQFRLMIVSRTEILFTGEIVSGYTKESPNINLNKKLRENGETPLNRWGLFPESPVNRYEHRDPETGEKFQPPNIQQVVQEHGAQNALEGGLVETNYPELTNSIFGTGPNNQNSSVSRTPSTQCYY